MKILPLKNGSPGRKSGRPCWKHPMARPDDRQALWNNLQGLFFRFVEKYDDVIFPSDPFFLCCGSIFYDRTE